MRWRLRGYLRRTITYPWARRIVVAVIGGSIVLLGVAMVVLPGPAIVVIPLGLGVLGLEFAWARHWLRKLRSTATDVVNRVPFNFRGWTRRRRESSRAGPRISTGDRQFRQSSPT